MRTIRWVFAGLVILVVLTAGCASQPGPTPTTAVQQPTAAPTAAASAEPIKIGAWIPLSGPIAVHGIAQRQGMESYYRMINEKGGINGRKIEWIVEDSEYDPQKSLAAARKLVERDQVLAIVGSNGTAQTAATFPFLLDEAKVPIVNPYGGAASWFDPTRANLYGVMIPYEDQFQALGRWAAKEGRKNILTVYSDLAAYLTMAKGVEPGVKSASKEAKVTLMPVKAGTTDYVPIALKVIQEKPDAVVMVQAAEDAVALSKELYRQNFKTDLYSFAPNASILVVELGGPAVDGLRATAHVLPPASDTPAVAEFRQYFKKYFPDAKPDYQSLMMWAHAKVFVEAVRRINGPITRQALVASLDSMTNYDTGILPPVTFSPTKHMGVNLIQLVQLKNGDWQLFGKFVDPKAVDW